MSRLMKTSKNNYLVVFCGLAGVKGNYFSFFAARRLRSKA